MKTPYIQLLLLSLCVVDLHADQSGVSTHRTNAGTPEADGWYTAASTQGAFIVRVPNQFTDLTVSTGDDGKEKSYVIESRSTEGIKFSAVRIPILKPRNSIKEFFEELVQKAERMVVLDEKLYFELDGHDCLDFAYTSGKSVTVVRLIGLSDGSLNLKVEYPADDSKGETRRIAAKYFASAKILKEEPNRVAGSD